MPIIIILLYLILCVIFPPALILLVIVAAFLCLAALGGLIGLPFGIIIGLLRRKRPAADVAPAPVSAPSEAKTPETPKGDSLGLALEWFGKGAGALLVLVLGVALVSAVVGGP